MLSEILILLFTCVVSNNIACAQGIGVLEVQNPKRSAGFVAFISIAICLIASITAVAYYFIEEYLLIAFDLQFLKLFIIVTLVGALAFLVSPIARKLGKETFFLYNQNYSFLSIVGVCSGILLLVDFSTGLLMSALSALFFGIGFLIMNFMFYAFEERMQVRSVNVVFRSLPIILFALSFIGMLFYAITMIGI